MTTAPAPAWYRAEACDLSDFRRIVETPLDPATYPNADEVVDEVLAYDADRLLHAARTDRPAVLAEFGSALGDGPGVVVVRGAFDPAVLDRAGDVFTTIIAEQRAAGLDTGDHYAKPGANDRVWNALEKLGRRAPEVFVDYYANPALAIGCEAWLGPGYQIASQINVVNPGGDEQRPHRDYHLGFLTDAQAERYPPRVHHTSPNLTLQVGVAHSDMPVEAGPTQLLPHSHRYGPGYLAWRRDDFSAYFAAHRVQPALARGDALFFNPAVFHAAGANRTSDVRRMANLLQVSSAFGRLMEHIDWVGLATSVYPALLARREAGVAVTDLAPAVAACADGYAFPTNLDHDRPIGGLAPDTHADLTLRALEEHWPPTRYETELAAATSRRLP